LSFKLYAKPNDARSNKVLVAAKFTNTDVKVDPDFKFPAGVRNKDFKNLNPNGKVPVLEVSGHGPLWESNAILRFIGRQPGSKLYGKDAYEAGLIDQWLDFASLELQLPADAWLFPIWGHIDNNPAATTKAQNDIRKVLSILNTHLMGHTFMVGERISLADIAIASVLYPLYVEVLDLKTRKPFYNVNRWFKTVTNQPEFISVLGNLVWAEKAKVAPTPAEKPKQEEKKEQPKKEQPKKVEKEEKDEGSEEPKEEKKKPNPLDSLPKSKLDIEEWKRVYSNEDTRTKALPWLWEHYDPEGYSIWFAEYKYNSELNKMLNTLNLAGGWIQRLDNLRKHGFGSLVIFGEEPALSLGTVWLFRGKEIPQAMLDCDDYLLYDWRKADPTNEADKKLIEDYFAWSGDFGGRQFKDAKTFK